MIQAKNLTEDELAFNYPPFRYMGSKHRLLPWIKSVLEDLDFETALDGFSGSGAVSYLLKSMGKEVISNDFLHFASTISAGLVQNSKMRISQEDIESLIMENVGAEYDNFIARTFSGIFFSEKDLYDLDILAQNILTLPSSGVKELAMTALIRSCLKKQPRGVFTVSGDLSKYNDGRKDLRLSIVEHFMNQAALLNEFIFDNGKENLSINQPIFALNVPHVDLVYLDPPYVPRSDDNCYVKRYHFVEGLSKYWQGEEIMESSKVKKIPKKYTPFSYRKTAVEAFDGLFDKFKDSTIVLSYSSNAFPDLDFLTGLISKYKRKVFVEKKDHRYHFGNHKSVKRGLVEEYLIIGLS